ncbi:MAG: sigma-70 family RNA polymerase sigma factor [Planctomycetaceae bacterium]
MNDSDRLLLDQIREGDQFAWQQLIALYEGRVLAFVNARLANRSLSEDIVQDTFIGFLTSLPNYDGSTPVEYFLFAIASHKLTDELRRQGRRPTVPLIISEPEEAHRELPGPARKASSLMRSREDRTAEETVIACCLQRLIHGWLRNSELERLQCAELLFVPGWANRDVALRLGISEKSVANHKHFIVSHLKKEAHKAGVDVTALGSISTADVT